MFNFNNNKKDNDLPQLDLDELFQRLEHLERKCRRMEARLPSWKSSWRKST